MRLFLLPLSTRRSFIYCDKHFRKSPLKLLAPNSTSKPPTNTPSPDSDSSTTAAQPLAQQYIDKFTTKAATTWADWERAEGGWKKQLTTYGNAALRRIPYEEWGLKSFPTLTNSRREAVLAQHKGSPVSVMYPSTILKHADIEKSLLTLAQERQSMHSKRMWYCMIGAPLTLPFALIPIIPNIPGIYLVFRTWSHFRALYGAKYLEFLVENKLYKPVPSQRLDQIYAETESITDKPQSPRDSTSASSSGTETILLTKQKGQDIAKALEVNELVVELERAVEQVEKAVLKDKEATAASNAKDSEKP